MANPFLADIIAGIQFMIEIAKHTAGPGVKHQPISLPVGDAQILVDGFQRMRREIDEFASTTREIGKA